MKNENRKYVKTKINTNQNQLKIIKTNIYGDKYQSIDR